MVVHIAYTDTATSALARSPCMHAGRATVGRPACKSGIHVAHATLHKNSHMLGALHAYGNPVGAL